jgi:L-lactate dehydrogenase (cytochrome)
MNSDLASALSIADLRRLARRTLPRILFDYLEGGAEDECGLVRNTSAFAQHTFLPRYLRDVDSVQSRVMLLGGAPSTNLLESRRRDSPDCCDRAPT